jgi:hypothetical protein
MNEFEGGQHIAIGSVQRTLALGLFGEEGAEGGLPIARRPELRRIAERAGEAAREEVGAGIGQRVVGGGVPA